MVIMYVKTMLMSTTMNLLNLLVHWILWFPWIESNYESAKLIGSSDSLVSMD